VRSKPVTAVDTSFVEAFAQAGGSAYRMQARAFRAAMEEESALRILLFRYLEAMVSHVIPAADTTFDRWQRRFTVMALPDQVGGGP